MPGILSAFPPGTEERKQHPRKKREPSEKDSKDEPEGEQQQPDKLSKGEVKYNISTVTLQNTFDIILCSRSFVCANHDKGSSLPSQALAPLKVDLVDGAPSRIPPASSAILTPNGCPVSAKELFSHRKSGHEMNHFKKEITKAKESPKKRLQSVTKKRIKKDRDAPKKPLSSFFFYQKIRREQLRGENSELSNVEIISVCSK